MPFLYRFAFILTLSITHSIATSSEVDDLVNFVSLQNEAPQKTISSFEIEYDYHVNQSPEVGGTSVNRTGKLIFEEGKLRNEVEWTQTSVKGENQSFTRIVVCVMNESYLAFNDNGEDLKIYEFDSPHALSSTVKTEKQLFLTDIDEYILTFAGQDSFSALVEDWSSSITNIEQRQQGDISIITANIQSGMLFESHFDIEKQYSMIKFEMYTDTEDGVKTVYYQERSLQEVGELYLPKEIISRHYTTKGLLNEERVITLNSVSVNKEYDDFVFTLGSIPMPDNLDKPLIKVSSKNEPTLLVRNSEGEWGDLAR